MQHGRIERSPDNALILALIDTPLEEGQLNPEASQNAGRTWSRTKAALWIVFLCGYLAFAYMSGWDTPSEPFGMLN